MKGLEGTAAVASMVRAEMARRGMRQVDMADMLGLSQAAVSRKLQGLIPFTIAELYELAERMGVEPAQFVPSEPAPPPMRPRGKVKRRLPRVDSNHQPADEWYMRVPSLDHSLV
jgi:transcriptional regulator with XRE-family HTH domain